MKKLITDYNLENKNVIIRVDYNVPIENGKIVDDTRIVESIKTVKYALDNNAKVILLSHLGRVKTEEDKNKNSLEPVAKRLSELLDKEVYFIKDLDFSVISSKINSIDYNNVILLENTRFYDLEGELESKNNEELSKKYASLGDIFINDAFGTIHRNHASNVGISKLLPNGIGFLVERELNALSYLDRPDNPYTVILGGSKVSDKIKVIENLVTKCDNLIIGGAMANTFLKANGYEIGNSKYEEDYITYCNEMLSKYKDKIILPVDLNTVKSIEDNNGIIKEITNLDSNDIILDLGIKTVDNIKNVLSKSKTVFWNGPLGYYEKEEFIKSTKEILTFLVNNNIKTILGGGDIVACSNILGLKDRVYHASTGGGATLEYLEGTKLPGLEIIQNKE